MLSPYFFSIRFRTILNEDMFVETISTMGKSYDFHQRFAYLNRTLFFLLKTVTDI